MSKQLRALTALPEVLTSVPTSTLGASQLAITPIPGNPKFLASEGTQIHVYILIHTQLKLCILRQGFCL